MNLSLGFIGFLSAISVFQSLCEECVENGPLDYLLTYKFSQDHVELFFCAVRASLGANDNPTPMQFTAAYKRLCAQNEIRGYNGNCLPQDDTHILAVPSKTRAAQDTYVADPLLVRKYNLEFNPIPSYDDHDYCDLAPEMPQLSLYKSACITYIADYAVKMTLKRLKCEDCASALTTSNPSQGVERSLIQRKRWGRLMDASDDAIFKCKEAEGLISKVVRSNNNAAPQDKQLLPTLVGSTFKNCYTKRP